MRLGFNILPLKTAHKDRGIGRYTFNLLEALKNYTNIEIQEFTKISELETVDVIHYPWFDFFFHTLTDKKLTPVVVTIHDVIPLKFKEHYPVGIRGNINFYLQKRSLKKCSAVITDSEASKKDIIKLLKIKPKKITVIPLAATDNFQVLIPSRLIHTRRKYNLVNRFLLYVGDADWTKNLPFLIKSFSNLVKSSNLQNLRLVMIGEVFLKNKEVNSIIENYKLGDKIIRVGKIEKEELVCFYNLAEIYIQPSFYEGFGLPVLEAMSCGTPVVSSNAGSLPEVGGGAAVYFDPHHSKQFESIIVEVLNDKSLQAKLSQLGLKHSNKFSWEFVAKKTLEVYSHVTNL